MRLVSIIAALALSAAPALAQDAGAPDTGAPEETTALTLPLVEGVSAAPDCGGLYGLAGTAQCMSAPLSRLPATAELYMAALPQAGWPHVGGGENQVLFQRVRDDGLCDFLVMLAFYDTSLPEAALESATGYLGFILRTEGACADVSTEGGGPQE